MGGTLALPLWAASVAVLGCVSSAQAVIGAPGGQRLRITNGCPGHPIWIAHQGAANGGVGPDRQNVRIAPGQYFDFITTNGLASTRYWPKMGCDEYGNHCGLGGSGGPGQSCVGPGNDYSKCAPPLDTKFEASFGQSGQPCNPATASMAGCDYVDVSLVDGFTLPFRLEIQGQCSGHLNASVSVIDCSKLSLASCPAAERIGSKNVNLKAVNPNTGKVSGCYSPCLKSFDDKWNNAMARGHHVTEPAIAPYCCPTPPLSAEQCRAGPIKDTAFVNMVHAMCPNVYAYTYDDGMGLLRCTSDSKYHLTFHCPSNPPPLPSGRGPPRPAPASAQPIAPAPAPQCRIGDNVKCPGPAGVSCSGQSCCPDGSICPSAAPDFHGCPHLKRTDCTHPTAPAHPGAAHPSPVVPAAGSNVCKVGQRVNCAGGTACAGNSCCPDGSTCPSAAPSYKGCRLPKKGNCLSAAAPAASEQAKPTSAKPPPFASKPCAVGAPVKCIAGAACQGNACCPDGSLCPSADPGFHGCRIKKKHYDCTTADPALLSTELVSDGFQPSGGSSIGSPVADCYSVVKGVNAYINTGGCHRATSPDGCRNACSNDPKCVMFEMGPLAANGSGACCFEYCRPPDSALGPQQTVKDTLSLAPICAKWDGHEGWATPSDFKGEMKDWVTNLRVQCQAQVLTRAESVRVVADGERLYHIPFAVLLAAWAGSAVFVLAVVAAACHRGRQLSYAALVPITGAA